MELSRAQWNLTFVILAVAFGSLMYRLTVLHRLEQTSLLFIGIPTGLALVMALTPKAKTVTGGILKAMTIALLVSGILLGEGFICILMSAPIFYLVGAIIGVVIDKSRARNNITMTCLLVLAMVPMSFEGASPQLSFRRNESVTATRIVNASPDEVRSALSHSPRPDLPLPVYLRLGFPHPQYARGEGLAVGDLRTIHFAGGEGKPGDLVMKVVESRPGYARFEVVSDKSKVAHWLTWRAAEVRWSPQDATHTRVEWTLGFERMLDPAWYFRPWERYATRLAADYLIRANADPAAFRGR